MIVSIYATKLTREIQAGIKNPSISMVNAKPEPRGTNTAKTPRTRDGKTYPGGRSLRRRLKRLEMRRQRYGTDISRGHERGPSFYQPGSPSRKMPGSMTH